MPDIYGPLRNAPVVEALVDVQVVARPGLELPALEALHPAISERYPSKRLRKGTMANIRFGPDGQVEVDRSQPSMQGYLFASSDGLATFQARVEGFTYNRLKPYPGWEAFQREGADLWKRYAEAAQPTAISRLGLRYINRLDLPLPAEGLDLNANLRTLPTLADGLEFEFQDMLMRLVLREPGTNLVAILTQAIDRGVGDPERLPLVLDIDVVSTEALDGNANIWERVDKMHALSKKIFFESLTPEARRRYE